MILEKQEQVEKVEHFKQQNSILAQENTGLCASLTESKEQVEKFKSKMEFLEQQNRILAKENSGLIARNTELEDGLLGISLEDIEALRKENLELRQVVSDNMHFMDTYKKRMEEKVFDSVYFYSENIWGTKKETV
jgi:predicted nuclease with TOPRIM domain